MAPLQQQLDARIRELDAALSAKLGRPAKVRFNIQRERSGETNSWLYTFDVVPGGLNITRLSDSRCAIDAALEEAAQNIAAMRSADDERADLYAGLDLPVGRAA